jgi:hypothetical protein
MDSPIQAGKPAGICSSAVSLSRTIPSVMLYRAVRDFMGPVAAFRLAFIGRAAS